MQPGDADYVADIHAQLDHSCWNASQWLEALSYHPCAWVLERTSELADEIIGYVIYQTRVAQTELLNIGIAAAYQGQGLAYEFLSASMQLLPEQAKSIFLEVRRSNVPAIGLYQKTGFSQVGERRDYYAVAGGTREDALIYKYDLQADS